MILLFIKENKWKKKKKKEVGVKTSVRFYFFKINFYNFGKKKEKSL